MVEGTITWEEGHVAAATFLERRGQFEKAEREYKALINQVPLNISAYLFLGRLYLTHGRNEEAAAVLLASTTIEQTLFANRALGILAFEPKDAIPFFQHALALSLATPEKTEAGYLLADAYNRDGKADRAIDQLQQVLRWAPDFVQARRLLQQINTKRQ
jgi:tetratricopeptide (TPR) repeat protein